MRRGFSQTRTKTCQKWQTNNQQRPLPGKRAEMKKISSKINHSSTPSIFGSNSQ